jgi:hypothetical protein
MRRIGELLDHPTPFRLEYKPDTRAAIMTVEGEVSDELLEIGYRALQRFCDIHSPSHCIIDCSQATKVSITAQGVRRLARKPPLFPLDYITMNIAPKPELYGMSRMFQALAENRPNFRVVKTAEEAFHLLNLGLEKTDLETLSPN